MARQDMPAKSGQPQQQRRKGDAGGKHKDKGGSSNQQNSPSPARSTPPVPRRSSRNTTNQSYLSSDPNFAAFKQRLDAIGLELRDIIGDGNCLFRALSDQLDGTDNGHLKYREDVVQYMLKNEHDFAPFVEDDVPFAKHIEELRQPGTFAGNDAIVAFARLQKVNIIIHQLDAPAIEIKGSGDGARQLHISYHNGDHYSSVRRLNDSTNKPVNIRLSTGSLVTKSPVERRVTRKSAANTSSGGFTDLQKINEIMERTHCEDVELIKATLAEHDNNVAPTVAAVAKILTLSNHYDSSSDDEKASRVSLTNNSTGKNGPKPRAQVVRQKKAEKKNRRMVERQEQYLLKTEEPPSLGSGKKMQASEVVVVNPSKFNIVSV